MVVIANTTIARKNVQLVRWPSRKAWVVLARQSARAPDSALAESGVPAKMSTRENVHLTILRQRFLIRRQLRGAWSDRDTNDIFAHCSLIFYNLDFKFSNFVCPSELHPLIRFFLKNSFRKKKNIRKTSPNALAPSIFIVWSIVLKLGTPLLHIQAQNTLLQNF